jgi:hypothetical protein
MLFRALEILAKEAHRLDEKVLRNAMTEAAVLHARSLCEVFLSLSTKKKPWPDDIRLSGLFSDWDTDTSGKFDKIKNAVSRLDSAYGNDQDQNSHHFAFNKLVIHSTRHRGAYGIYDQAFHDLEPIIREIVGHIEALTGYTFNPVI